MNEILDSRTQQELSLQSLTSWGQSGQEVGQKELGGEQKEMEGEQKELEGEQKEQKKQGVDQQPGGEPDGSSHVEERKEGLLNNMEVKINLLLESASYKVPIVLLMEQFPPLRDGSIIKLYIPGNSDRNYEANDSKHKL